VPVSALLAESRIARAAAAVAVLCSPAFFASILFIRAFAAAKFSGAALGSNLLGSLAGGLLESLSMWTGLRSLLILALVFYVLSFAVSRRKQAVTDQVLEEAPAFI
jgi:hypothetical protein